MEQVEEQRRDICVQWKAEECEGLGGPPLSPQDRLACQ